MRIVDVTPKTPQRVDAAIGELVGACELVRLRHGPLGSASRRDLPPGWWPSAARLLVGSTRREGESGRPIEPELAEHFARCGVRLLGVDAAPIDPPGEPASRELLAGAGVVMLEGLELGGVPPGRYGIVVATAGSGLLARVLLVDPLPEGWS